MADPLLDALSSFNRAIERAAGSGDEAAVAELTERRNAAIASARGPSAPQEEYRSEPMPPPAPVAPPPAPPIVQPSSMGGSRMAPPPATSGEAQAAIPPQAMPQAPPPAPPTTPGPRHAPGSTWGDWLLKQYELIKQTDPSYAKGQSPSDIAIAAPLAAAKQVPFAGPWVDEALARGGELVGIGSYDDNRAAINKRVEDLRKANPVATGMIELTGGAATTGALAPLAQGSAIANTLLGTGGRTLLGSVVKGATSAATQAANRVFGEGDRTRDIWDQIQDAYTQGGIAGAIGGGVPIALGGANWLAKKAAGVRDIAKTLPTYDELARRESGAYTHPEYLGAEANEQAAKALQADLRTRINPRIADSRAPQSYGVVDDMLPPSSSPGTPASTNPYTGVFTPATPAAPRTMPLEHLEHQRQALGNIPAGTEEVAKSRVRKGIDNFLENLTQGQLAKGNAANVAEILKSGRLASSARQTLDMIGRELEWKPALRTSATHSSQNADNQLRQAANRVSFNENETRWMTQAERDQLEKVAGVGATDRNFLRNFSKMFPTAGWAGGSMGMGMPTTLAGAGHFLAGIHPAIGAAAALPVLVSSAIARKVADTGTKKAVEDLTTLVRARGAGVQDQLVEQWRKNEMLNQLFGTAGAIAGR